MKKLAILLLAFSFMISPASFAERTNARGPDARAYENSSEDSIFNRMGDWFATRGKTGQERKKILSERKTERAAERKRRKAKKKAEKMKEKGERAARETKTSDMPGTE